MSVLAFRPPRTTDAAHLWRLAPQQAGDDRDSCYAYLLLCSHFADTGIIASRGDDVVGFALGYRPPTQSDQLFVWQLGISPDAHDDDLGARLLDALLARPACADVRFLCMTRTPRDRTLHGWLEVLARRRGARCTESACFPGALFATEHPDELLLRVGPLA
jgi:L-2,4-diaminobutyric acid acetyltransferase